MAEASAHNKEMENLMGTKIPVAGVEERKFNFGLRFNFTDGYISDNKFSFIFHEMSNLRV